MSRHKKKTRKQKVLADLHRKIQSLEAQNFVAIKEEKKIKIQNPIRTPEIKPTIISAPSRSLSINTHSFLIKDISKTGILTAVILALQFILFFLLKNRIISLQGLNY